MNDMIKQDFQAVQDFIMQAELAAKEGELVSFEALDAVVKTLCGKLETLPKEELAQYEVAFNRMVARLNGLQEMLDEKRTELEGQVKAGARHGTAARAYVAQTVFTKRDD